MQQSYVAPELLIPMRGYILIHIGGYKMVSDSTFHVFTVGKEMVSVPDRLVQTEVWPFGSLRFYEDGWVVGDNSRDRFCRWRGDKPMRRFRSFDEAVAHAYRLRQKRKRPHEVYTLVYVTAGVDGNERSNAVSSLADITSFESEVSTEIAQHAKEVELRQQHLREEYPELERLREIHGVSKAFRLSSLLKTIRQGCQEKAMLNMSKSSFYKDVQALRKLGLLS